MKKSVKKIPKYNYIYLFRHGKTSFNEKGIFTGLKNPGLSKEGIKNAEVIAKKLKHKHIGIAIETKLVRSKQTLKIVLKHHPECKKILIDNKMIERSYGKLEGMSHEKFIENIGKKVYNLEVEGDAIENLDKKLRKKVQLILGKQEYDAIHRGYNVRPPGGESFADVEKRVQSFIKYLIHFIKKHHVNVAISAHGNSIRLFRKIIEHLNIKKTEDLFVPYDKVFVYRIKG